MCSHQNGLTCKEIAAKDIAPEKNIYWITNNFKERGSTAVKKSSGCPRVSSERKDRLLLRSQLRNRVTSSAELAQEWQQEVQGLDSDEAPFRLFGTSEK
ncbi:hypothetical protein cypCar_00037725 [Cyprinus carpio]|nr:hypothetical protein cypCar_00037725 [Cyprinus carpio]